jgi:hypothetical protein
VSTEFEKASDIAEYLLRRTGVALMSGDFDAFAPCFILPQHLETIEGAVFVTDRETLHQIFRAVRANYRERGVTRVVRHCLEAKFKSKNLVESCTRRASIGARNCYSPPTRPIRGWNAGMVRTGALPTAFMQSPRPKPSATPCCRWRRRRERQLRIRTRGAACTGRVTLRYRLRAVPALIPLPI